jgi:trans-aconitate 2-methyltransferase
MKRGILVMGRVLEVDEVKDFYDDFFSKKMLDYRINANIRINRAIDLILSYVRRESFVVEVGSGIGIVTEAIAKKATEGKVIAFELGERNVWYAKRTVAENNVQFVQADIFDPGLSFADIISEKVNLFVMVDVIEHLPADQLPRLFEIFASLAAENAHVVLTYPSPQYQNYLRTENPRELQIVDNTIELEPLLACAGRFGFCLKYFKMEDVWMANQYVHVVLQSGVTLRPLGDDVSNSIPKRIASLPYGICRRIARRYRQWKYVDRVFRSADS